MAKIEIGRYSSLLRRLLSMKGTSEVSGELSPEISPVLILESERPEWEFLKNEHLMALAFGIGNVAAQNAVIRLRNPATSGAIATLTLLLWTTSPASSFIWERDDDNGDLATVLPTVSRDTRLPVLNASSLVGSQANGVVLPGESWATGSNQLNENVPVSVEFVLTPGHEIDLATLGNDISARGFIWWRERRLDVLERFTPFPLVKMSP